MDQLVKEYDVRSSLGKNAEYDIGIGEFRTAAAGEELFTSGASTCIVLVAHNRETGRGLIGHFTAINQTDNTLYSDTENFEKAIDELPELGQSSRTEIALLGGAPYFNARDGVDEVQQDREFAISKVTAFAKQNNIPEKSLAVNWSAESAAVDVKLLCGTGVLLVAMTIDK